MISVVIPIYNVEKYVERCMETIINQSYKDIEIIVVDDGSEDASGNICEKMAQRDERIIVIHQENRGLSAARNTGIEMAGGEFIVFVDSDDMMPYDSLKVLYETAVANDADIVCGKYVRCKEKAAISSVNILKKRARVTVYDDSQDMMSVFLDGREIGTMAWAKIYRRGLFEKIRYPNGKYHEDVFTTYQLIDLAERVITISNIVYIYRINNGGITRQAFSDKKLDLVRGKIEQARFIETNYRELRGKAYASVVYACNQCVWQMALSNYRKENVIFDIQVLYRRYLKYYLKSKGSVKGKLLAFIMTVNVKLSIKLIAMGNFK